MYKYDPYTNSVEEPSNPPLTCSQGHRSSHILKTEEGGHICLLCFTNLISNPNSPTFHVSYALSQFSHAISQPSFLSPLLHFHFHLILSPLVNSLASFHDEEIARELIHIVSELSAAAADDDDSHRSVAADFVERIADALASAELAWTRRQLYSLHCLGVLLTRRADVYACIKDKASLINNLVIGLQLPCEEIRGEVLFVLYKICILQCSSKDEEGADVLLEYCPMILHLSLDVLMKTKRDDVRLNCLALLNVLGQRGYLSSAFSTEFNMMETCEADNYTQTCDAEIKGSCLCRLFADAVKSSLLSSECEVQASTLDLIILCLSSGNFSVTHIQVLVEENVADYIFEILRLSEYTDHIISSCIRALELLSIAECTFEQRLALGFSTLVSVLPKIAEVPYHPTQPKMLKLILDAISISPGVVSLKLVEAISSSLAPMLKRYAAGEMGMLSETFTTICCIFIALVKSPSSGSSSLLPTVQEASIHAILASLSSNDIKGQQLLYSLSLLNEAYSFSHNINSARDDSVVQLRNSVIELCQKHIVPWFITEFNGLEEEIVLGVMETLHFIMSQSDDNLALQLTSFLLSVSWFSLSFRCLGIHPTERMKLRVYLMFGTIVDNILGEDSSESISAVASALPMDPVELLFLLGQKNNIELLSCHNAVLQILYISSLNDEMLADKKLVLTSLEQYMLENKSDLRFGAVDSNLVFLLNLYALCRSFAKMNYQICYSSEAEKIFFEVLVERDWDLSSFDIFPSSLKWLFQQEKICQLLLSKIHKLSLYSCPNGTLLNSKIRNFEDIAYLASVGDNFLPKLLVLLLKQLSGENMLLEDVVSLLVFISSIINLFPCASDQLNLHGMSGAVQNICTNLLYPSSLGSCVIFSRFIFIYLCYVQSQSVIDDEAWLAVTMKLLDSFKSTMTVDGWTEEHLLVLGVLSLVLHHSTQGGLVETAKFILLNSFLASLIRTTFDGLFKNGSASIEQQEETDTDYAIVFLLLYSYFYLRSLQVVFPGSMDWMNFIGLPEGTSTFPSIGIICQDICRFLYFGSTLIKVVASYCLLELLIGITERQKLNENSMHISMGQLRSMFAVLECLAFHSDLRIAINSSLCLSMIVSLEIPKSCHTCLVRTNSWCRVIVEELVRSFSAPCSVATSLMNQHRPAVHIAIALLKANTVPLWMGSVLNKACVAGIIENLSPNNISIEVVLLLQQLLLSAYLKPDQLAKLSHLLQACKQRICANHNEDDYKVDQARKVITMSSNLGEVCEFLFQLMSSGSHLDINSGKIHTESYRLMEEIDLCLSLLHEMERN